MRRILAPILLVVLLFPSLALGETMDDLVETNGVYFKKFTEVPFDGTVTGRHQGKIKDGKQDGLWVAYFSNGGLWSKGTFKDGKKDGPWVAYYDNGQIQYKGTFKDGEEDGLWVGYYVNGQLWSKGTYKDGEEDGLWVTYLADRTVWEEYTGTFKNGVKVD